LIDAAMPVLEDFFAENEAADLYKAIQAIE
jgi:hypothetical protein